MSIPGGSDLLPSSLLSSDSDSSSNSSGGSDDGSSLHIGGPPLSAPSVQAAVPPNDSPLQMDAAGMAPRMATPVGPLSAVAQEAIFTVRKSDIISVEKGKWPPSLMEAVPAENVKRAVDVLTVKVSREVSASAKLKQTLAMVHITPELIADGDAELAGIASFYKSQLERSLSSMVGASGSSGCTEDEKGLGSDFPPYSGKCDVQVIVDLLGTRMTHKLGDDDGGSVKVTFTITVEPADTYTQPKTASRGMLLLLGPVKLPVRLLPEYGYCTRAGDLYMYSSRWDGVFKLNRRAGGVEYYTRHKHVLDPLHVPGMKAKSNPAPVPPLTSSAPAKKGSPIPPSVSPTGKLQWKKMQQKGSLGAKRGQLDRPCDVAVDTVGRLFFSDYGNNRIQIWTPEDRADRKSQDDDGTGKKKRFKKKKRRKNRSDKDAWFIFKIWTPADFRPIGVAWSEGELFATEFNKHCVVVFDGQGTILRRWGSKGNGPTQFSSPAHITVVDNEVYVVDCTNHRVSVFSRTGVPRRSWGTKGTGPGQMKFPWGIAVHGKEVFITDKDNSRVQVFDRQGKFLRQWGSHGSGPGQLAYPMGVTVRRGAVFVCDQDNTRIVVFDTDGKHLGEIPLVSHVYGVAFDRDQLVLVRDACVEFYDVSW